MIQLPDDFNASDEFLNFQNNTKPKINKSIHIKGFKAKQKQSIRILMWDRSYVNNFHMPVSLQKINNNSSIIYTNIL